MNITALYIGRVGDLLVSTPVLRGLRERFPQARIRLVTSAKALEAARIIPFADEIGVSHYVHHPLANLVLAFEQVLKPCDLLVDLNPSFSRISTTLAVLTRAKVKVGFEKRRLNGVYTRTAPAAREGEHMLDLYKRLADFLDVPFRPELEVRISPADEAQADSLLSRIDVEMGTVPHGPSSSIGTVPVSRLLIHPGNFKNLEFRWPEGKFVELTNRLLKEESLRIYYLAGLGEKERVAEVVSKLERRVPILDPAPLGVVGALLKRMDLCLLNITGTMHLASAVGARTFGLYCKYLHAVWRPLGPLHTGIVSDSWEDMREIPVEAVHEGLKGALSAKAG